MVETIKTCPFCGEAPKVFPTEPKIEGDAWGAVRCRNWDCNAMPDVRFGGLVSDDRGSDAYKALAIERWNTRFES